MDYSLLFGSLQRRLFVLATVQKNSLMFANENFFVQITASALVGRKHKSFIFLDFFSFFLDRLFAAVRKHREEYLFWILSLRRELCQILHCLR